MSELVPLSASRIKTFKECSWKYFCTYILKLPETRNDGASKGWICHLILECLFLPRRQKHFKKVTKDKTLLKTAAIKKLIEIHAKKLNLNDADIVDIDTMTMNALNSDFFGKKKKGLLKSFAEQDFDLVVIKDDGIKYRVKGFIDQMFLYKDGTAVIRDFKSSKKKFSGKEIEDNLQDYIYSLFVKKEHKIEKVHSEFLFLRFDLSGDGVIKMKPISNAEHEGFEFELTAYQEAIQNFDEDSAKRNFAARGDYPKDGSFSGPLMCGRAKTPNDLKVDGTKMWHCPYKFAFEYYCVVDFETDKTIRSAFERDLDELKTWLANHTDKHKLLLKKRRYNGCPAIKQP